MGNVAASGMPSPPPVPTPPPSVVPEKPEPEKPSEHPGSMEELHKKCKDLFPMNFEGAKLMINKGLSNHFQVSHTLTMSSMVPSGYRFGVTYVGTKQLSPTEAFPVLLGDIDPSGNLNANIIHQFTQRIRGKMVAQIQSSKFVATQMTADYKGTDNTASLTLGNIDIVNESGVVVAHYLKRVHPQVDLGAELAYQYGPQIPGSQIAVMSIAGRYNGDGCSLSGTLGAAGLHLCYHQKCSDQVQMGAELEASLRTQECVATVGYQVDLPKADLVFRGMIDSNWTVGAVMEKKLTPLPFTFALSGLLNHTKGSFRLGCGLIIG